MRTTKAGRRDPRARVVLRAASGTGVGLGHAMRSLAVALEVVERGGEALLVLDDAESAEAFQYRLYRIPRLEVVTREEAADWTRIPTQSIVLDGFRDWSKTLLELKEHSTPTLLVENRTPAREHAKLLLYPALHHVDDEWDKAHRDRILSGPGWIPLRSAIVREKESPTKDIDLLITFGGSDPNHLTERVLRVLAGDSRSVAVAVGSLMEARRGGLEALTRNLPKAVLLESGTELAPWMARSRAAVTALGTTLYELAYHGVPAGILANYRADEEALAWYAEHPPHNSIGVHADVDDAQLLQGLKAVSAAGPCVRPEELGSGASRLAELLLSGLQH